jgi:hypothetical protein
LLKRYRRTDPLIRDARILGIVDPPILDALLSRAAAILLPKMHGGGSNLKTSEALLADRPIVATTQAFVGFEPWVGASGVTVEDDPALFWVHVARHLSEPVNPVDTLEEHRNELLWPACVAPLVTAVQDLVNPPGLPTRREMADA